jgi:hypothetical protein
LPAGAGALSAFGFAVLAPLRLVLEALIGKKHLLAGGEDEFRTAFAALQDSIVVFHVPLPKSCNDSQDWQPVFRMRSGRFRNGPKSGLF